MAMSSSSQTAKRLSFLLLDALKQAQSAFLFFIAIAQIGNSFALKFHG
jgi:hypothetical protein